MTVEEMVRDASAHWRQDLTRGHMLLIAAEICTRLEAQTAAIRELAEAVRETTDKSPTR